MEILKSHYLGRSILNREPPGDPGGTVVPDVPEPLVQLFSDLKCGKSHTDSDGVV